MRNWIFVEDNCGPRLGVVGALGRRVRGRGDPCLRQMSRSAFVEKIKPQYNLCIGVLNFFKTVPPECLTFTLLNCYAALRVVPYRVRITFSIGDWAGPHSSAANLI